MQVPMYLSQVGAMYLSPMYPCLSPHECMLTAEMGKYVIFDLNIKDPFYFGNLFSDLDHTQRSLSFHGDLDLRSQFSEIF